MDLTALGAALLRRWYAVVVGLLVSLLFSLVPLLGVRHIRPSLLLRQESGGATGVDWLRAVAIVGVGGALVALAASVGIAGARTAIYPFASPGGWHLIGTAVGFTAFDAPVMETNCERRSNSTVAPQSL